jgi:hypothetical protein
MNNVALTPKLAEMAGNTVSEAKKPEALSHPKMIQ